MIQPPADARRRVWRFLASLPHGATAGEIAAHVLRLRITEISERAVETIVSGLLSSDPRFLENAGRWCIAPSSSSGASSRGDPSDSSSDDRVAEALPEWDAIPPEFHEPVENPRASRGRLGRPAPTDAPGEASRDDVALARARASGEVSERATAARAHAERLVPAAARHRLPAAPGVYLFRAQNGRPLYVGKAKNLRRRVLSHFHGPAASREVPLWEAAARITFEVVGSEAEALLRELDLIARHAPRFNTQRAAHRGRDALLAADLIFLLPTPAPSHARVFVLRAEGAFLTKEVARRGGGAALRAIVAFATGARPRRVSASRARHAHTLAGILRAWYRANRDAVTVVDPRRVTRPEDLERILREHLADSALFHERSERI